MGAAKKPLNQNDRKNRTPPKAIKQEPQNSTRRWGGPTAAEWAQRRKRGFESIVRALIEAADKAVPGDALTESEREKILSEKENVKESSERLIQIIDAADSLGTQQEMYFNLHRIMIAAFKTGFLGMTSEPNQRKGYKKSKGEGGSGKGHKYSLRDDKINVAWAAWKSSKKGSIKKGDKKTFAKKYLKDNPSCTVSSNRIVKIIGTYENASDARKRAINGNET